MGKVHLRAVNAVLWHRDMGLSGGSDGYVEHYDLKKPLTPKQIDEKGVVCAELGKVYPVTAIRAIEYGEVSGKMDLVVAAGDDWSLGSFGPCHWPKVSVFRVKDYNKLTAACHAEVK
jgi:hypothetical protein